MEKQSAKNFANASVSKKTISSVKVVSKTSKPGQLKAKTSTRSILKSIPEGVVDPAVIVPLDGGWGWLVVLASFIINFVADGIVYCFGMFLIDISRDLKVSTTQVALASSVMTGCYYMLGPIVCAILNRHGFRFTAVIGGIVSALGITLSSFLHSLPLFVVCFGILCGFGFSLMYVPSVVVVGFYFEKWRAAATSIAVCGSSAGMILFPPVFQELLGHYTWRTKFRILSGACLFCSVSSLVYKPVNSRRIGTEDAAEEKRVQFSTISETDLSTDSKLSLTTEPSGIVLKFFKKFSNAFYPTMSDVQGVPSTNLTIASKPSSASYMLYNTLPSITSNTNRSVLRRDSKSSADKLDTLLEEDMDRYSRPRFWTKMARYWRRALTWRRSAKDIVAVSRPMYRDDVFYTGSIFTLSEYSSVVNNSLSSRRVLNEYHISVTRVITQKEAEEISEVCKCCPVSMKRTFATMLQLNLMRSPAFLLLLLSGCFTTLGMYTPFIYISAYAMQKKMEPNISLFLLSALGISNCCGRLLCGFVSTIPSVDALRVSCVSLIICGSVTISSVYFYGVVWQFLYASIFGVTIAALPSLRSCILVDLLGLDKLTNAFGIIMLFQGLACLAGLPISGILRDFTGSYDACFFFAGTAIVFSGLLLIPVKFIGEWEKKKTSEKFDGAKAKSRRVNTVIT